MEQVEELKAYIASPHYREALGLPVEVTEEYQILAQGEYNRNYKFVHPVTGQKLLFRINYGSQMHLEDQIGYEYHALQLLEQSGRTPKPLYVDGSRELFPYGVMVMEYLPGKALDYCTDLPLAAECLADIHSIPMMKNHGLLIPQDPLQAILEECEEMVKTYMESPLGDKQKKKKIRKMLDMGWEKLKSFPQKEVYHCCINTELNSTNFLINGEGKENYLIDWEKPLYGEPAQDLGHFLAPTTTFWKTDVLLKEQEIEQFIDIYLDKVAGRFDTSAVRERTYMFLPITCLRGVIWCAMAWVQYQDSDKEIVNASTMRKLNAYLEDAFLEQIICFIENK